MSQSFVSPRYLEVLAVAAQIYKTIMHKTVETIRSVLELVFSGCVKETMFESLQPVAFLMVS
jgi:hypothetical protein